MNRARATMRERRILRKRTILDRNPLNPKPTPHLKLKVRDSLSRIRKGRCRLGESVATRLKGEEWIRSMWESVDWNEFEGTQPFVKNMKNCPWKNSKNILEMVFMILATEDVEVVSKLFGIRDAFSTEQANWKEFFESYSYPWPTAQDHLLVTTEAAISYLEEKNDQSAAKVGKSNDPALIGEAPGTTINLSDVKRKFKTTDQGTDLKKKRKRQPISSRNVRL